MEPHVWATLPAEADISVGKGSKLKWRFCQHAAALAAATEPQPSALPAAAAPAAPAPAAPASSSASGRGIKWMRQGKILEAAGFPPEWDRRLRGSGRGRNPRPRGRPPKGRNGEPKHWHWGGFWCESDAVPKVPKEYYELESDYEDEDEESKEEEEEAAAAGVAAPGLVPPSFNGAGGMGTPPPTAPPQPPLEPGAGRGPPPTGSNGLPCRWDSTLNSWVESGVGEALASPLPRSAAAQARDALQLEAAVPWRPLLIRRSIRR